MTEVTVNLNVTPAAVAVALTAPLNGVPAGGVAAQVLTKTGPGPTQYAWQNNPAQTAVDQALADHVNAADPHPGYTTPGEAAAAAPVQSVNGQTGNVVIGAGDHTHDDATTSVAGFLSAADKTKLDGVAAGATANASDAQLRDRGTHTGEQAIGTVTGLTAALAGKSDTGHTHVQSEVASLVSDLAAKSPLASPAFTGTPTVPTAAPGTNTTQAASTAFVLAQVALAVAGLLEFRGSLDASANPNYPAADKGDTYYVNVAGKVGGASGVTVAVGDAVIAKSDNAGGTEAGVGTSWFVLEKNLQGALLSANNLSDLADAATARTNLGLGDAATKNVGSTAGTVAAGDDARLSDTRTPTDGSVTAAKVSPALKPSGTAAAGDESLRALGTSGSTACAGNDARLSDARTPTSHTHAIADTTGLQAALDDKAPLASPALTGTPTVPTAAPGTDSTQAASTAFVAAAVAAGGTSPAAVISLLIAPSHF